MQGEGEREGRWRRKCNVVVVWGYREREVDISGEGLVVGWGCRGERQAVVE